MLLEFKIARKMEEKTRSKFIKKQQNLIFEVFWRTHKIYKPKNLSGK